MKTFNLQIGYEAADQILIELLKDSIKRKGKNSCPQDEEYEKKYIKAARLVIEHFGGKP